MISNATIKFNHRRARRMTEDAARKLLEESGFQHGEIVRKSAHYDGVPVEGSARGSVIAETTVEVFHSYYKSPSGAVRCNRAMLSVRRDVVEDSLL